MSQYLCVIMAEEDDTICGSQGPGSQLQGRAKKGLLGYWVRSFEAMCGSWGVRIFLRINIWLFIFMKNYKVICCIVEK